MAVRLLSWGGTAAALVGDRLIWNDEHGEHDIALPCNPTAISAYDNPYLGEVTILAGDSDTLSVADLGEQRWVRLDLPTDGPPLQVAGFAITDEASELFALTDDGRIWHRYEPAPRAGHPAESGSWQEVDPPRRNDGQALAAHTGLAVTVGSRGAELFSLGDDGVVRHRQRVVEPGWAPWTDWQALPDESRAVPTRIAATAEDDGGLALAALTDVGSVQLRHLSADGDWTPWETVASGLTEQDELDVIAQPAGTTEVRVVRDEEILTRVHPTDRSWSLQQPTATEVIAEPWPEPTEQIAPSSPPIPPVPPEPTIVVPPFTAPLDADGHTAILTQRDVLPLLPDDPRELADCTLRNRLPGGGSYTAKFLGKRPGVGYVFVKHLLDTATEQERSLFEREVRHAKHLRRVKQTAAFVSTDDDTRPRTLVMRFIAGPTLPEVLQTSRWKGSFDPPAALEFGLGLLTSIEEYHGNGLVHCDVKPSNIVMLDSRSPYLIDVGAAQPIDRDPDETQVLQGTPGFASPEVRAGEYPTRASDVWSWAAVIAFASKSSQAAPTPDGSPPEEIVVEGIELTQVPGPLAALLERALSSDPDRRPTVRDLRYSLTQLQSAQSPTEAIQSAALTAEAPRLGPVQLALARVAGLPVRLHIAALGGASFAGLVVGLLVGGILKNLVSR